MSTSVFFGWWIKFLKETGDYKKVGENFSIQGIYETYF